MTIQIWLRAETKADEHRTPLTPSDAAKLIESDFDVCVEESEDRVFKDADYAAAGCRLVSAGSWTGAPLTAYILGIKELPAGCEPLRHRHIYFGHAYKDQSGWKDLLQRFSDGGGTLLDLEFLTDDAGRRVSAFGFWAGFAGAALGIRQWAGRNREGIDFMMSPQRAASDQNELITALQARLSPGEGLQRHDPSVIVVGALGRCGRGAVALFDALGIPAEQWDVNETEVGGPFPELLSYDILVNTVLLNKPIPPFLTPAEIHDPCRKLSVISDVSCDPGNPGNPLPIYDQVTTFKAPVLRIIEGENPLDIIAVDHLPSLLPRESSIDFSFQLFPHLMTLPTSSAVWERCQKHYQTHVSRL